VNNQRSFYKFLVAGVLALLLIGIAGFYWVFAQRSVGVIHPHAQPDAAAFISKQSPVMVSLLVNPDQLETLEQAGKISFFKNNLFAKTSIDYQQDIQPWLGNEVTLAVTSLDIDRDPKTGLQPGYLMALATKDLEKSRGFIEYLFSQKALTGADLVVQRYQGVKIVFAQQKSQSQAANATNLASAVVNNFVLFANDIQVIREAINNLQAPELDLKSFPLYQNAIEELPKKAIAVAFLNLPTLAQWQGLNLTEFIYHAQISSLVLRPQGILAETTFLAKSGITHPARLLSQPVAALQYIPDTAELVVTGTNLKNLPQSDLGKLWQQGVATFYGSQTDIKSKLPEFLTQSNQLWGLNLSHDIFSWVTGEYAIATLPSSPHQQPNWVFVAEKSSLLGDGISNLDAIALAHGVNVSYFFLNQQKVSAWTQINPINNANKVPINVDTEVIGVHISIDNYEIFASDLQILDRILRKDTIIKNRRFQREIATIPKRNQGFIYIDWSKSRDVLEAQLPLLKYLEVLGQPLFDDLRSLILSSYSSTTGLLKGGVFFQFN